MVAKKTSKKAVQPPKFGANTIRVRMYRIGFGDCFLVSLPVANQAGGDTHKHVLVDCGVHAKGDLDMIDRAVDHIGATTGKKLAIVIATHSHQDHISGFSNKFTSFEIGEVWMPWCENPKDKQAAKLTKKHAALAEKLERHFAAEARTARVDKTRAAAMAAVANLVQNKTALGLLRSGFNVGADVQYFAAGDTLKNPAGVNGLSVRFLGPPRDEKFLSKMDPPTGHSYLRMKSGTSERLQAVEPFADRWQLGANDPSIAHLRFSASATEGLQEELATPSLNALAFALAQAGEDDAAIAILRAARQRFPDDPNIAGNLAALEQQRR